MENKLKDRQFIKRALLVAALILFIVYFSQVTAWAKHLWAIAFPLILGFVIAFILNILMKLLEKRYFPNSKRKLVLKTRRPVCMLLAFALIVALVTVVVNLVLPQVMDTLRILADIFPSYVAQITQWFSERQEQWPAIAEWARKSDFTLESISAPLISFATEGVNGIVSSSVSLISALAVGLFNLIVALAFSFYLLLSKERLLAQLKKLQAAFMKRAAAEKLNTLLAVANESFSSFIVGQCTEAIILGVLCMLGMGLLGFPYATPVGIFIEIGRASCRERV